MWVLGAGSPSRWRGFGCFSVRFRIDFCSHVHKFDGFATLPKHNARYFGGASNCELDVWFLFSALSLSSCIFSVQRSRKTVKSVHPRLIGSSTSASSCALFDCVRHRLAAWMQECVQELALPISVHALQLKPDVQLSGDLTSELIEAVSVCDAAFRRSDD